MGVITKLFWQICLLIDSVAYGLLKILFKIFNQLSTVSIFDNDTITGFYNRIWVFIGIVVLMKLAIALVNYMVNPDDFGAEKKGFGSLVTRVMVSLVLLVSFRYGFKEMYHFQYIITSSHVVETAIFGYNPYKDGANSDTDSISNSIVLSIYSGFFQHPAAKTYDNNGNVVETNALGEKIDQLILNQKFTSLADYYKNTDQSKPKEYVNYLLIISFIAGFFVDYLLLIFCFDIAIRSIKLGLYEALAPLPIIMYIDPKTGDDRLQKWLKAVGTTYLDLFIRIGIINFIIFIISLLQNYKLSTIASDGSIETGTGSTDKTLLAFIIIGLFMFAKQIPDLLKDLTGIDLGKSGGSMFDLKAKTKGVPLLGAAVAGAAALPKVAEKATINKAKRHIANEKQNLMLRRMNKKNITDATDPKQINGVLHPVDKLRMRHKNAQINKYKTDSGYSAQKTMTSSAQTKSDRSKALLDQATARSHELDYQLTAMANAGQKGTAEYSKLEAENNILKLDPKNGLGKLEANYNSDLTAYKNEKKKLDEMDAHIGRMKADASNSLSKGGQANNELLQKNLPKS